MDKFLAYEAYVLHQILYVMNTLRNNEKSFNWKVPAIIFGTLFLVAVSFWYSSYDSQQKRHHHIQGQWQNALDEANAQKVKYESEFAVLEVDFGEQIVENDSLEEVLQTRLVEISDLKNRVYSAQKQLKESRANADEIRSRLAQLEDLKTELENDVVTLTAMNDSLVNTSDELRSELQVAQVEVATLNNEVANLTAVNLGLAKRLNEIAPAGFVADNFVIKTRKKNQKLTSKATRTQSIEVEFDINHVPGDYHKNHEIYLVVTDQKGEPVSQTRTMDVIVKAGDVRWPVQAVDVTKVELRGDQLLAMSFEPADDLQPGQYHLVVYADNGLLGATGFQLR